jgi:hypothetical protein
MFQAIAPKSPAITMTMPCVDSGGAMTLPTVFATSWPRKAPMKFMTAAIASAILGVSARVETDVAIAFAASWNPLV